jgi:hypothetical protein
MIVQKSIMILPVIMYHTCQFSLLQSKQGDVGDQMSEIPIAAIPEVLPII